MAQVQALASTKGAELEYWGYDDGEEGGPDVEDAGAVIEMIGAVSEAGGG
jgi:hypothetical protein